MFSSDTMSSRDISRIRDGGGDLVGSNFFPDRNQGLAVFKSAPSSYLAALMDSNTTDNSSSSRDDESEVFLSALMSGPTTAPDLNRPGDDEHSRNNHDTSSYDDGVKEKGWENGSTGGKMGYERAVSGGGGCIVGSYSVGMESGLPNSGDNNENIISSSLVRQSSSPPGFFNGFGVMGGGGKYRVSSANGMSNHLNFSSCSTSMGLMMPTINQNIATHNLENGHFAEFEDSPSGNILKRNRDAEMTVFPDFNGLDNWSTGESSKGSSGLVHHLSLPKAAEVENLLQFQPETVPCKVRAKRGCATHPRSIAERMRRTRISERMKKLQDLFPNMDKQTSTADMLELAVSYIKDLQKQVKTLTDKKANCVCSSKPQQEW